MNIENRRTKKIKILTLEDEESWCNCFKIIFDKRYYELYPTDRIERGYFLSTNPSTVLSHYLNLSLPKNRVRRRNTPLDMLIIIANPEDQTPLNPDEWERMIVNALDKPLDAGKIKIRSIKRATRKEISKALLEQQPDIVQFVGHGIYHNGKGYLALVDDRTGNTWEVDDERFSNIFLGAGTGACRAGTRIETGGCITSAKPYCRSRNLPPR